MANLLTALRLLLVIPMALAFAKPGLLSPALLFSLLLIAVASDYFDGIVARRRNTASANGQLFDHGTDCLLVTCSTAGIAFASQINPWLAFLIAIAFSQYVLDSYFLYRDKQLRMSMLGRWNGIFYFIPLFLVSLSRFEILADVERWLLQLTVVVGYLLALSTVASIIDRAIAPLRLKEG